MTDAFELYRRYVSPSRAAALEGLGFSSVQGRREGVRIHDEDGRAYINCRSSGGVFNLGHRPEVTLRALRDALEDLDVGDWLLPSGPRAEAARRLADLLPGDDWITFFTPGGGEAVDVAIKLARGATGRSAIVCAEAGYHGHTGLAMAAGDPRYARDVGPLPGGFVRVPFGDPSAAEDAVDERTAAVLFETIPATGGILIPPEDLYPRVRKACDAAGAVMILDEVQAGLGRTGRAFAFEEWEAVPDVVVTGKGLGGAVYPVSAVTYRSFVDEHLAGQPFFHPSSFGGAEPGMAVACAVLDELRRPGFLEHVAAMGDRFGEGLEVIRTSHPGSLLEVRRRGLMIGLEMPGEGWGPAMTVALARRGVLAVFANNRPSTLQVMPPLVIEARDVDLVLGAIEGALGDLEAAPPP